MRSLTGQTFNYECDQTEKAPMGGTCYADAGYTKGSGQSFKKLEVFGETTVEMGGNCLHGWMPVRGAELQRGGLGQIRLVANK